MRRARAGLAGTAVAIALVATACSGGDHDAPVSLPAVTTPAPADSSPAETTSPAPAAITTPQQAADAIGCTGYARSGDPAPHVDEWGTCELDGHSVSIYAFADDDAYRAFLEASAAYGVTEAWLARTGNIAVAPTDQTQLPRIKASLGGP